VENWLDILQAYHPDIEDKTDEEQWKLWKTMSKILKPMGPSVQRAVRYEPGFERFVATGSNKGGGTSKTSMSDRSKRALRQNIFDYQLRYFVPHGSPPDEYNAPWHLPQHLPQEVSKLCRPDQFVQYGFPAPADEASWERHLARPSSKLDGRRPMKRKMPRMIDGRMVSFPVQRTFKSGLKSKTAVPGSFVTRSFRRRVKQSLHKKKRSGN
jgi:hypothetical protein